MEDFIASNAGWIIILIVALAYPVKKIFSYFSSKVGVPSQVTDIIVDDVAEFAKNEVEKLKIKHNSKIESSQIITTPSLNKDGFRVIKQPSNPNNYTNNGEIENEKAKDNSDSDKSDDPDRSMQL